MPERFDVPAVLKVRLFSPKVGFIVKPVEIRGERLSVGTPMQKEPSVNRGGD